MPEDPSTSAQAPVLHNLFFALVPPSPVRKAIRAAATALRRRHPTMPGRWLTPERYHLTLHYLGGFDAPQPVLTAAALDVASGVRAGGFTLALDQVGHFGSRVGWLGCADPPPGLEALRQPLAAALALARIRIEGPRTFVPHLTLVRGAVQQLGCCAITPIAWPVTEFALIDSRLGATSTYATLGQWLLEPVS